jgi:hypothetical protein
VLQRDVIRRSVGSRLHQFTFGKNPVAASNCSKFIDLLKQSSERPVVLVIGGGTIGAGAGELYSDSSGLHPWNERQIISVTVRLP